MSVTEEWSGGEVTARIRRVGRLGGKRFLGRLLVECADVGGYCLLGGEGRHGKAGRQHRGETRPLQDPHFHGEFLAYFVQIIGAALTPHSKSGVLLQRKVAGIVVPWVQKGQRRELRR